MVESKVKKLKIGNVELENNIILGPMAGLTDRAFRLICEEFNPGLVVTEMISAKALYYKDEKTKKLLNIEGEKGKIAIQIFGSDLQAVSYSAKYISNETKADIIDINMGCPAPKIVKNGDGSKLLLDIKKVYEITKAVVDNSLIPVTVKIRKGWDSDNVTGMQAAKAIESAGAKLVTVHGRTRAQYYSGEVDLNVIKEIKENLSIPVVGNGDIKTPQDAEKMFDITNCDGIMVSRASLGNPWIFEKIRDYLENRNSRDITYKEVLDTILKHISLEVEEKGEDVGIKEMRKHICYYLKNMKNASEIRNKVNHLDKRSEVEQALKEYFKNYII